MLKPERLRKSKSFRFFILIELYEKNEIFTCSACDVVV